MTEFGPFHGTESQGGAFIVAPWRATPVKRAASAPRGVRSKKRESIVARKRVLAIASGGGHWVQLMRLRPAFADLDVTFVSRDPSSAADVEGQRYFTIGDASRSQKLAFLVVILQAFWLLLRVRPAVIITTGAAPGLVALALGKTLFRAKTIWIDSIANVETLSGSGVLAARFADIRLTQWPDLATDGVEHWGAVL